MPRKCSHGKYTYFCKDCGGKGICEHNKRRQNCKECSGSSICKHGRQHQACRECKGKSICHHGTSKTICKECGGSSICEHGKRRVRCKQCRQYHKDIMRFEEEVVAYGLSMIFYTMFREIKNPKLLYLSLLCVRSVFGR